MAERLVILDSRNRELAYVFERKDLHERIRQLKERGKKPMRIITKKVK